MEFLMLNLANYYADLGEETRLNAMTNMWNFRRLGGEHINDVLTRFETTRYAARTEGDFVMSFEGYSMSLLSPVGISDEQLLQITSRYQGRLPNTEADFQDMMRYLRRMGHILEG